MSRGAEQLDWLHFFLAPPTPETGLIPSESLVYCCALLCSGCGPQKNLRVMKLKSLQLQELLERERPVDKTIHDKINR